MKKGRQIEVNFRPLFKIESLTHLNYDEYIQVTKFMRKEYA